MLIVSINCLAFNLEIFLPFLSILEFSKDSPHVVDDNLASKDLSSFYLIESVRFQLVENLSKSLIAIYGSNDIR